MRIGYDISTSYNIHGTGTYASNVLDNLKKWDINLEFVEFDYLKFYKQMNMREKSMKFMLRNMSLSSGDPYWEWYKIPKLGHKENINIYHSMGGCVPRSAEFRTVQTVHDLAYYYFPEYLPWRVRRFFKTWYKFSAKSADAIITISESTKNDIIKFWKIPEEKIHVIHHGVSEAFFERKRKDEIKLVLAKYNVPTEYFLFVGELNYRKNIHTLIKSFGIFKNENKEHKLVLAGKPQEGEYVERVYSLINEFNLKKDIIMTGRISKDELLCLYQGATAFVFPSLYEGFGLPVLEAMASGTPVISSNTSSIPEIAGDAAILVDPIDEITMAKAISDTVRDSNLIDSLKQKGKARAGQFTWQKTAKNTLELYHRILV